MDGAEGKEKMKTVDMFGTLLYPGDKVYGKHYKSDEWVTCYYESYDGYSDYPYRCYTGDEWSGKRYCNFKYVKKATQIDNNWFDV